MKILKNNLKVIIAFIVGVILAGGIVYAAVVSASEVSYTTAKNANITNVQEALNDLYSKNQNNITITSTSISKVASASYTFQDDYKAAIIYIQDNYNSGSTWSTTCENANEIFSQNWPSDQGYTRYILLKNVKKDDVISASHSGNKYSVILEIVFIK